MVASFTSPNNVLITQPDKSATLARRVPIAGITSAPGAKNRDGTAGSSASISRSLRGSTRRITHCRPDRWYRRSAEKIHRNRRGDGNTCVNASRASRRNSGDPGGPSTSRAASAMRPYCTPDGQAVSQARHIRHK